MISVLKVSHSHLVSSPFSSFLNNMSQQKLCQGFNEAAVLSWAVILRQWASNTLTSNPQLPPPGLYWVMMKIYSRRVSTKVGVCMWATRRMNVLGRLHNNHHLQEKDVCQESFKSPKAKTGTIGSFWHKCKLCLFLICDQNTMKIWEKGFSENTGAIDHLMSSPDFSVLALHWSNSNLILKPF